jgi:hypothetical protein
MLIYFRICFLLFNVATTTWIYIEEYYFLRCEGVVRWMFANVPEERTVSSFKVTVYYKQETKKEPAAACVPSVEGTGINLLLYVMFYCRGERAELLLNSHALSECCAF